MARYPRSELPEGWALLQTSDGKFQVYEEQNPERKSSKTTRRVNAITWAWAQVGQDAQDARRTREREC